MSRHAKLGGVGLQSASYRQCVELFNDTMVIVRQWLHEKAPRTRAQIRTRDEWNGLERRRQSGCTGNAHRLRLSGWPLLVVPSKRASALL